MDKKVLEQAHELGRMLIAKRGRDFEKADYKVTSCGVVYDREVDPLWISGNTACHAGLDRYCAEVRKGLVSLAVVSQVRRNKDFTDEMTISFLDWLLNRSPYSHTYAFKDAAASWDQGYIIADANADRNMLVGGLVASRRMWEKSVIGVAWYDLVQLGCEENMAFWLAHQVTGGEGRPDTCSVRDQRRGHTSLQAACFSKDGLSRWCRGDVPKNFKVISYAETNQYGGYSNMYGPNRVEKFINIVSKCVKIGPKVTLNSLNPFPVPATVNRDTMDWAQAMQQMVNNVVPKLKEALA